MGHLIEHGAWSIELGIGWSFSLLAPCTSLAAAIASQTATAVVSESCGQLATVIPCVAGLISKLNVTGAV